MMALVAGLVMALVSVIFTLKNQEIDRQFLEASDERQKMVRDREAMISRLEKRLDRLDGQGAKP